MSSRLTHSYRADSNFQFLPGLPDSPRRRWYDEQLSNATLEGAWRWKRRRVAWPPHTQDIWVPNWLVLCDGWSKRRSEGFQTDIESGSQFRRSPNRFQAVEAGPCFLAPEQIIHFATRCPFTSGALISLTSAVWAPIHHLIHRYSLDSLFFFHAWRNSSGGQTLEPPKMRVVNKRTGRR